MSTARTARRRRKQYKHGNLDQIFGARHAPTYRKQSASKMAARLRKQMEKIKAIALRKGMRK